MEIKITNDKKEKSHSFEASAEGGYFGIIDEAHGSIHCTGYGASEAEARKSLAALADNMMADFKSLKSELDPQPATNGYEVNLCYKMLSYAYGSSAVDLMPSQVKKLLSIFFSDEVIAEAAAHILAMTTPDNA